MNMTVGWPLRAISWSAIYRLSDDALIARFMRLGASDF